MALFGLGNKKEDINGGCDCGGACEPKTPVKEESEGCCGENCNSETMTAAEVAKKEGSPIKVLGSGCVKCNQLETATKEALEKLGMDDTIDHITDFSQIAAYGVMTTPALVVDGKVVSYGKVLKTEQVVNILQKVRG